MDYIDHLKLLGSLEERNNISFYIVGGAIRDLILKINSNPSDFDCVSEFQYEHVISAVESFWGKPSQKFPQFLTAKWKFREFEIDIAQCREEHYPTPGALPIVIGTNFNSDFKRRDFTINSLYSKLPDFLMFLKDKDLTKFRHSIIDPLKGLNDLDERIIRILHEDSFTDDPTRIFRGIRYAARIDGSFSKDTEDCLEKSLNQNSLDTISWNRILNEIELILSEDNIPKAIRLITAYNVFKNCNLVTEYDEFLSGLDRFEKEYRDVKDFNKFEFFLWLIFLNNKHPDPKLLNAFSWKKKKFEEIESFSKNQMKDHPDHKEWGIYKRLILGS